MTISQADARRAIELLLALDEQVNGKCQPLTVEQAEELSEFLYDDSGEPRFEERDIDPSPDCRCETCPQGGPYTCVSED